MSRTIRQSSTWGLLAILLAGGTTSPAAQGTIMPVVRHQFFDANGDPVSLGKLCTYTAGTSSPLSTYSDVELLTSNANPIILNSAGRPASGGNEVGIYLLAASYKFVLRTAGSDSTCSTGTVLWTQDNVSSVPARGKSLNIVQGRLTLESGVAVSRSDQTAKTTLRYTPYQGNEITLHTGEAWATYTFSELSIAVPNVASQMYDVFAFVVVPGTTVSLSLTAWTNDTTRATALTTLDGVLVKTGSTSLRYLGSFRTTTVAGQTEDSLTKRFVWNYYHRVSRPLVQSDATASWAYSTATVRQVRATSTNRVEIVIGVAEVEVVAAYTAAVSSDQATVQVHQIGIGLDTTTSITGSQQNVVAATEAAGGLASWTVQCVMIPDVGYHAINMLERGSGTATSTWAGTATHPGAATLIGSIEC